MQPGLDVAVTSVGDVFGIGWLLQSIWIGCAVVALFVGISMLRQSRRGRGKQRQR